MTMNIFENTWGCSKSIGGKFPPVETKEVWTVEDLLEKLKARAEVLNEHFKTIDGIQASILAECRRLRGVTSIEKIIRDAAEKAVRTETVSAISERKALLKRYDENDKATMLINQELDRLSWLAQLVKIADSEQLAGLRIVVPFAIARGLVIHVHEHKVEDSPKQRFVLKDGKGNVVRTAELV